MFFQNNDFDGLSKLNLNDTVYYFSRYIKKRFRN